MCAIVWQWQDKAGTWRNYPSSVCGMLEGVYCDGGRFGTTTVTGQGEKCVVDLWTMTQEKAGVKVRRCPADKATSTQGMLSSSSSSSSH